MIKAAVTPLLYFVYRSWTEYEEQDDCMGKRRGAGGGHADGDNSKAGAAQGRNHKGTGNEGHGSGPYGQGRV